MKTSLLIIGLMLGVMPLACNAVILESATVSSGTDSGLHLHPVGRWVGADELDIRFVVALPEFTEVDKDSMHFEISGNTIVLRYRLADIPHTADQPIPACQVTKTLTYVIKGIAKQSYQVQLMNGKPGGVATLPIVPTGPDSQPRYALKLRIFADGALELDGKAVTESALEKAFKNDITYQLPVWFHSDSDTAQKWLDLAIEDQLPFAYANKPDFSDLMEKTAKH